MTLGKILDIHQSSLVARGGRVGNKSNKEPHDVKTPLNDVVCFAILARYQTGFTENLEFFPYWGLWGRFFNGTIHTRLIRRYFLKEGCQFITMENAPQRFA